jgi:cytochrome oxidase assembly protein ShyY1
MVSKRRWFGYLALVIVFAAVCVALSQWQFARRESAQAQMTRLEANYSAAPEPISKVLAPQTAMNLNDQWKPVSATGKYLPELQVLVRNRTHDSAPGFDVISPFLTTAGVLLVIDRGWIPAAADGRSPSSIPALPSATESVIVRLIPAEPVLQGQSDTTTLISSIHVPELATAWKYPAYTGAFGSLVSEDPQAVSGILASRPELSEGNHLSYALQWIAFAVLGFIGLAWAVRNETRVQRGQAARQRPRSKRIDIDADAEDALLDASSR